jgi:hypothetical protein
MIAVLSANLVPHSSKECLDNLSNGNKVQQRQSLKDGLVVREWEEELLGTCSSHTATTSAHAY